VTAGAAPTSEAGRRLQEAVKGRYALERELGRGGMATVFLARDLQLPRTVAIKLLDPTVTSSIGVERFLREIEITARFQHPHILPLIDSGRDGRMVYYVMPHVSGESLRERLVREQRLSVAASVNIARDVADALAYAHEQGVVHRDVKPENILLSGGHAIVADFGIARAVENCANCPPDGELTIAGAPIGTPAYMSPEQAEGRAADGRSDVYALGCVLFEMLTGRPPFVAKSARAIMTQHVTTPPPALGELRPGIPAGVAAAVERALAKEPAERFPTARELADVLQVLSATEVLVHATPSEGAGTPVPAALAPAGAAPATPGVATPPPAEPAGRGSRLLVFSAVLAVLALTATMLLPHRQAPRGAPVARRAASIAVMPLENYSSDEGAAFLSEGLTEEIIAQLARIRGLKVISRTSVVAVSGKGLTVPQIADTLGVGNVLEGSVQRAGDRIRVTLQLIDAADAHLWAESYERDLKDAIALRREIAQKVVTALALAVPGVDPGERTERTQTSPAYDAYLRGSYWLTRTSPDGLDQAIRAFEDAVRADSTYAPAYAGLSSALRQWVTLGYAGEREPYATFARAAQAADRALELDPDLAAGYIARGLVRAYGWAPADVALEDLERGLALLPNAGSAHAAAAVGLMRLGRHEEALAQAQMAVQLDPLSATAHGGYAVIALGSRRYDLAIQANRRVLGLEPNFVGGRAIEGVAQMLLGHPKECLALDLSEFPEVRAICLNAAGRVAESAALADSVAPAYMAGRYRRIFQLGILAAYYAQRGDAARAAEWIQRAYERSPSGFEFRVIESGLFDPVRDDPRWQATLDSIHRRVFQRVFE